MNGRFLEKMTRRFEIVSKVDLFKKYLKIIRSKIIASKRQDKNHRQVKFRTESSIRLDEQVYDRSISNLDNFQYSLRRFDWTSIWEIFETILLRMYTNVEK